MFRAFHKDEMLAGWPIFYYIFRYLVSSNIHHNKLSKLEMRRYWTIKTNKILISKEREKEAASKRYKCTRLTKNYHSMLTESSKTCLTLSIYTCAFISVIPLTNFRYKIFMSPFIFFFVCFFFNLTWQRSTSVCILHPNRRPIKKSQYWI